MKFLITMILTIFVSTSAFAFGDLMRSNRLSKSCTGANYATSGTQSSTNFGVSYGSCSGFSCNGGFTVSGSNCVAAGNVVCGDSGLGFRCIAHPNAANLNYGSQFAAEFNICIGSCSCTTQGWLSVRKKYQCSTFSFASTMDGYTQSANSCGGAPSTAILADEPTMNANCTSIF